MEQLNIILFGSGFIIAIIALIIMMIKALKGNKVGLLLPLILIIGIGSIGSGIWLIIQQNSQVNTTVANNSNNTNTTVTNSSTGTNQVKEITFDANGSVVPKTTTDEWSRKIITDADGSKTVLQDGGRDCINITPNGTRIFQPSGAGVVVQIPENKSNPDGKLYTQYGYGKDDILGEIHITKGIEAVSNETSPNSKSIPGDDKEETYNTGSKEDIKLIDFVYQVLPSIKPKNTIANNFLSGNYVGKEEKVLSTNTTMSINILDDKLLDFKCSYISGMDNIYGYKIEPLGKNAYKLYLYPATIKADSNGGGVTIADEPIKRTFIIYMKSKDSFDIVFTSDDIKRASINMNKQ